MSILLDGYNHNRICDIYFSDSKTFHTTHIDDVEVFIGDNLTYIGIGKLHVFPNGTIFERKIKR